MSRGTAKKPVDPFAGLPGASRLDRNADENLWSRIDTALLHDMVTAVTGGGSAIVIGLSSDGGAMSLTLLSNGEKRRFWAHAAPEMDDLLTTVIEWAAKTAK